MAMAIAPVSIAAAGTPVSSTPHIVARPDNVMVNSSIRLIGTGFPADTTIALRECASKGWIVPQNPCDTNNGVSVTTDALGGFKTSFKAELCPRGVQPGSRPVTSDTCYIGEPKPAGIDTIELVGAAKITVTYP